MNKIIVLFLLVSILLTACNLSNSSGNDEQIVSMQQTMDAMQSQLNSNEEEPAQVDPPTEDPPTKVPPTQPPVPTSTSVPTEVPPTAGKPSLKKPPTNTPTPLIPFIPHLVSDWGIENGVCRDDTGGYPRWSSYDWTFSQCEQACKDNPNCQGFAMSTVKNYCQLFGSDGANDASHPGTHITRGDLTYPEYTCYIKPYLK